MWKMLPVEMPLEPEIHTPAESKVTAMSLQSYRSRQYDHIYFKS